MQLVVTLLFLLFLVLLFWIGGKKGVRALISFGVTIVLFVEVILPLIIHGQNPVVVVLLAALPMLALIIYCTEGFSTLSHLSVVATAVNFFCLSFLIEISVRFAHLTGMVSDEASSVGASGINLPQLLVAGMLLGTLGVLTEMVVTQVATVFELAQSNPLSKAKELYAQAYAVGMAHLGSIITTLFLVYAGVSLPTLVIFLGEHGALSHVLNYEPLVDEMIRTLVGTIGLIVAMPISTRVTIWWLRRNKG